MSKLASIILIINYVQWFVSGSQQIATSSLESYQKYIVLRIPIAQFRETLQGVRGFVPRPLSSQLSLSAWIITGTTNRTIMSLGRSPGSQGSEFRLFIDSAGMLGFEDKLTENIYGFHSTDSGSQSNIFIADNIWHHIAFVKNGTTGEFFVDGKHAGTITSPHDIAYRNEMLCIAADCRHPQNSSLFFQGMLDDFVIFDTALNGSDISVLSRSPPKEILPVPEDPDYQSFITEFRRNLSTKVVHQHLLTHVLETYSFEKNDLILEFGVWMGSSINNIARHLPESVIVGFDSFEGLPEDWSGLFVKGSFNMQGHVPAVLPNVALMKGWFTDTIPQFKRAAKARVMDVEGVGKVVEKESEIELPHRIGLLHIDCDLYSSTKTVFNSFKSNIRRGTIIIFDELLNFDGYERHEMRALYELVKERNITFDIIGIECIGTCQPVAIVIT
eukprot:gene11188-23375_t